jgi:hypothetical protein
MDLTFRTLGAWGSGKGANLTPGEVDNNFWELAQAIVDLAANPALPVGIANITVSGTSMTITLTDGTVMGPFTLPVLTFRWRGEWQPFTTYAELDVFTVTHVGIYMVQVEHTTGAAFEPDLLVPPTTGSPAYLMLFGSTDASLSALPDVALTDVQDGDVLVWDEPTGTWQNVPLGTMADQDANAVAITGGTITGMPVPSLPTDVATKAYVDAGPAGGGVADSTMMSNIVGALGPAIPNTLSAFLDHVLGTTVRGTLLYRGGTGWLALLPGTSGLYLRTAGSGADPAWAAAPGGVTSVTAGTGISTGGSPITSTGTVALAAVNDSTLIGNAAGSFAAPVPLTLTQFLDHALTSARGTLLVRNVTGWNALAPGTAGQYLKSAGTGVDLTWDSPLGAGTVTSVSAGTGLTTGGAPITAAGTILFASTTNGTLLANISGSTAAPTPSTLSLILDTILSSTQGAVLYRDASAWAALGPGTSGQVLTTGGTAANPSWASTSGAAPIAASNILSNLTAGTAVALGHTLSDTLDYIISSSRGTLLYRGASGWAGLAPGTSGYVLSTGGTTGDPSWIAPAAGGGGSGVGLIAKRAFTAGATYTPTTGTGSVIVTVVGGGGAGGGVAATTSTQQAEGSGGGSGGAIQKALTAGFSGVTITVGAAGAAASGAVGGNGGSSSFGSYTAGGGTGGAIGTATANAGVLGGAGGTATGGDLSMPGSRGWVSSAILNGGGAISGRGGDTPLGYGTGGEEQLASAAGVAGNGYGSGGSGAINGASQSARAGGNGAAGLVIVEEYSGSIGMPTPTIWNIADKTASVTLSGGNLTAVSSALNQGVRAADGQYAGKYYFEVTATTWTGNPAAIELGTVSSTLGGGTGASQVYVGNSGNIFVNGSASGSALGARANGDIIGIAVDLTNHLIWFRAGAAGNWNGSGTANPVTGTGGVNITAVAGAGVPLYPLLLLSTSHSFTANFGGAAFVGTVPSGYAAGWLH